MVIATRNRCHDTLVAIESALAQDCPVEVLVYDDASDDGTTEAIARRHPDVRLFRNAQRTGYIVNRNRGFRDARAPVVFSLDDDAYFSAPDIVSRTLNSLATDPAIAAVAIPYIEPLNRRSLSNLRAGPPPHAGTEMRSYIGCAHAVRTAAAIEVGGYREFFIHQREEPDLCLRMLNAGWKVVYGDSAPIVHMVSPKRDAQRVSYYGARNQILSDALNVPMPELFARIVRAPIGILVYRFSLADVPARLRAISAGWAEALRRWPERQPVSRNAYSQSLKLPGHGPMPWGGEVPAPCRSQTPPPERETQVR